MVELGEFTQVEIQDIWPTEPGDFTPWLAENLDRLGEALNVEFSNKTAQTEVNVGHFRLDLLADDDLGRKVAIENQYGKTNHDHLGKLLTYAAGVDASVLVWLVETFEAEHRQAVEWLNRHTHEGIEFYAVQLSAVKIGESLPVPVFEVVGRPNKPSVGVPDRPDGQKYLAFWEQELSELRKRQFHNWDKKARNQTYCAFWNRKITGGKGVGLVARFTKGGAEVHIVVNPSTERNLEFFELLQEEKKEDIQHAYGKDELHWDIAIRKLRIQTRLPNATIEDAESKLNATVQWMAESMFAFRDKVIPMVNDAIESFEEDDNSLEDV